jgi:hypothetical protein
VPVRNSKERTRKVPNITHLGVAPDHVREHHTSGGKILRTPKSTERGNAAVKDGSLPDTLQSILEDLKPEAAYFADIEGARGGYLVVNMDNASQIPAIAEPLFLAMDATVQVHTVFTPEDMPGAMESLQQAAQKYG